MTIMRPVLLTAVLAAALIATATAADFMMPRWQEPRESDESFPHPAVVAGRYPTPNHILALYFQTKPTANLTIDEFACNSPFLPCLYLSSTPFPGGRLGQNFSGIHNVALRCSEVALIVILDQVYFFSQFTKDFYPPLTMSDARKSYGTINAGNRLYLYGGRSLSNPTQLLPTVLSYGCNGDEQVLQGLSVARDYITAVTGPGTDTAAATKIIFAGGVTYDADLPSPSSAVDILDIGSGTWTRKDLNTARYYMGGACIGNYAFFAGGVAFEDDVVSALDIYNFADGTMTAGSLISARYFPYTAVVNNMVLFASGLTAFGSDPEGPTEPLSDVDLFYFCPITGALIQKGGPWLSMPRYMMATGRLGQMALFMGGKEITNGTYASAEVADYGDVFDTRTGQWATVPLSQPRYFPKGNPATCCVLNVNDQAAYIMNSKGDDDDDNDAEAWSGRFDIYDRAVLEAAVIASSANATKQQVSVFNSAIASVNVTSQIAVVTSTSAVTIATNTRDYAESQVAVLSDSMTTLSNQLSTVSDKLVQSQAQVANLTDMLIALKKSINVNCLTKQSMLGDASGSNSCGGSDDDKNGGGPATTVLVGVILGLMVGIVATLICVRNRGAAHTDAGMAKSASIQVTDSLHTPLISSADSSN